MTRISQAPGGASTITFGDYTPNAKAPPSTPPPAAAAPAAEAPATPAAENGHEPASAAVAVPQDAAAFEQVKSKAIASLAQVKLTPEVAKIVAEFLAKLEATGSAPRAVLSADEPLAKLKDALKQRGTHGIISLGHKFRSIDDDGDNKLSFDEFRKALLEMNLTESDTHKLFRYFDADCSGYLSFDELLVGLRGELNPRRLDMVERAFKVLDVTGDGQVTLDDVKGRYDASKHPDVLLGTKTEDQVLGEFLEVFEAQGGGTKGDGIITFDEFKKYYASVSASVDLDDYFELIIRNAWHISGGEGWCANTTCKRVLVLHEDGSQEVVEVKDDFDISKDQYVDKLKAQGVANIKSIALYYSDAAASTTVAAAAPPAAKPAAGVPSTPTSPTPGAGQGAGTGRFSASANKKGADHFRSSIQFG